MRAVQLVGPEQFEVVHAPEPEVAPGQALLRIRTVGLCGSDRFMVSRLMARGAIPGPVGVSGHECIGTVEASRHPSLAPGDEVLYLPLIFDGMAEYVAVDPALCVPVPAGLEPRDSVMSQQLGTVIWACQKLPNVLDRSVAIIGQGPAGLNFTAMLRNLGAREIIAIDRLPRRLEVAHALGATHVVDARDEDAVAAVRRLTGGEGVDLAIEAVGHEATVNQAYAMVRTLGTVLIFGVPETETFPGLHFSEAFRKQITTLMSVHAQQEPGLGSFRLALDFLKQRRIDLRGTISHCLPLADAPLAYDLLRTGRDGAVKVLVEL